MRQGGLSLFAYAVAMALLVRCLLPRGDIPLTFAVSLLCPIALAYVHLGVASILIPAAAAISFLILTTRIQSQNWKWNFIVLLMGSALGATDWHIYGLIPIMLSVYLLDRYRRGHSLSQLLPNELYIRTAILSVGMVLFLIAYKSALMLHLARCESCYELGQPVSIAKLLLKTDASAKILGSDAFLTTARAGWTILIMAPAVLILWLVGEAKWSGSGTPNYTLILALAVAVALVFAFVLPGQTSPSAHGFEILVFVMPACLATAAFIPLRRTELVRAAVVAYLTLVSVLIVSLPSLLPSSFLQFTRLVPVEPPLLPSNYNLTVPVVYDSNAFLRAVVHQLGPIPDTDPSTTGLLRRNKMFIQEHVARSSILTLFGSAKAAYELTYEINRAVSGVNNLEELRELVMESHHEVLILLPWDASLAAKNQVLLPLSLLLSGPIMGNEQMRIATVQVVKSTSKGSVF